MTQLVFCSLYSKHVLLLTEQEKQTPHTTNSTVFVLLLVCAHSADTLSLAR